MFATLHVRRRGSAACARIASARYVYTRTRTRTYNRGGAASSGGLQSGAVPRLNGVLRVWRP